MKGGWRGASTKWQQFGQRNGNQFFTPTLKIFRYAFSNPAILAFLGRSPTDKTNSYANAVANLRTLARAHIPILAGTDAFGTLVLGITIPFGLTLHYELQNLVEVGLSPAAALRAATSLAARHHRLRDRGVLSRRGSARIWCC
ncbi:hypothetical protein B0T22DRAFT_540121 [Podospora appendiculata]|uniref:Uncharacterized protein n=1 Tax=Podospora appendiculata TaxID=314037 RepID=A0AAE0X063_9PEZI|nr:hypothetical protein B0T22DRAFT_540121 [Podospora appendiculata]